MTRKELLTKAKPILFNTEMVQAILAGRKTVTRRVIKKLPERTYRIEQNEKNIFEAHYTGAIHHIFTHSVREIKPPYAAGDYLYVRETWNISNMCADGNKVTFIYRGDKSEEESARTITVSDDAFDKYDEMMYEWMPEWRPSIHMPKEAARIFLKVNDVRVERLQNIIVEPDFQKTVSNICAEGLKLKGVLENYSVLVDDFKNLWNSTIKKADLDKYGWEASPWVWVIEFERVEV